MCGFSGAKYHDILIDEVVFLYHPRNKFAHTFVTHTAGSASCSEVGEEQERGRLEEEGEQRLRARQRPSIGHPVVSGRNKLLRVEATSKKC